MTICQGANSLRVINRGLLKRKGLAERLLVPVVFSSCCYWYSCLPIRRHWGSFHLSCVVLPELGNVFLRTEESLSQISARCALPGSPDSYYHVGFTAYPERDLSLMALSLAWRKGSLECCNAVELLPELAQGGRRWDTYISFPRGCRLCHSSCVISAWFG